MPLTDKTQPTGRLIRLAQKWGQNQGLHLVEDGHLNDAAARLLPWAHAHAGEDPPPGLIASFAQQAGVTDAALSFFAIASPSGPPARALHDLFHRRPTWLTPTHVGAASDGATLVLLFSRRRIELSPIAWHHLPGGQLVLTGRPLGLLRNRLELSTYDAAQTLVRQRIAVVDGVFVASLALGRHSGPLDVELLGDFGGGLEVASHFAVVVGDPRHPEESHASHPTRSAPARPCDVWREVMALRHARGLPSLRSDPRLAKLAQQHAEAMRDAQFFSHEHAATGDAATRLKRAGFDYVWVFENLALGPSAWDAVDQWQKSPAHLANLVDSRADRIGVGIATGPLESPAWTVALLVASP